MFPAAKAAFPTQTNYNIPSRSRQVDANLAVVKVSWEKQQEERQS
jgi:hypothetical protein